MDQQFVARLREALRYAWMTFVMLALSLVSVVWVARGATYNFYFNNTEQGDNSTATPQVTVSDGKATKSGGMDERTAAAATPAPAPAPSAFPVLEGNSAATPVAGAVGGNSSAIAAADLQLERPRERKYFRLTGSYVLLGEQAKIDMGSSSYYGTGSSYLSSYEYSYTRSMGGGALGVAFFPTRGVGLNLWGGSYDGGGSSLGRGFAGADLELLPIRLQVWKITEIEAGVLLGASTLRAAEGNWASGHAGARLAFNFSDSFSVTGAVRANLGYTMGDFGLAVHL